MLDDGGILKLGVMAIAVGPSCPLHLGVLDSPDYWTDEALVSAVRPLSAHELHQLALGSERERRHQQGNCLLYTSPSPRDGRISRMPSSA